MSARIALILILLLFSSPSPDLGAQSAEGPMNCAEAAEKYRVDRQAMDAVSQDCQKEVGYYRVDRFVDECFSVDKAFLVTLLNQMEVNRGLVCQSCQGEWPERELGAGNCFR